MFAKARCILVLIALSSTPTVYAEVGATETSTPDRLTIDRLYSLPHLVGTAPRGFSWSSHGHHLAFLWNDSGFNFRDVWTVDTQDPNLRPQRVTSMPQTDRPDEAEADGPLAQAQAQERWERNSGVSSVTWNPGGENLLIGFRGDLWHVGKGSEPLRVTDTPERESRPAYSPDGEQLAYLHGGELWSMAAEFTPIQRSQLSGPDVRVGDFRWAPNGSHIAILEMDERLVTLRGIPDYLAEETTLTEVRRAYPGEEPARQRLGILAADSVEADANQVRWIEWGKSEPDMLLSYRWSPDGRRLAIDTSDLYAKDRRIFVVDVTEEGALEPRLVAGDQDPYNETFYFWQIEWSIDSQLLYFLSDRAEDYHVYAVDPSSQGEPKRLTRGDWAVAEMFPVDGGLIVIGNRGNGEERHLFRVTDDGGEPRKISQRPGTHAPTVSPDGRWAAVHFSSQGMPPELLLTSLEAMAGTEAGHYGGADDMAGTEAGHYGDADEIAGTGTSEDERVEVRERRVTQSPLPEFDKYTWVEAQFVTFPSHIDSTTLHGRLTLPANFDPTKIYPAILGSVYTDSVRNQWGGRTAHPTWGLDQYLSQEGYILLNVDMRGSWGRGREHRRGIRLDYGGLDIEDLESGVRYLDTLGYVDMNRVGIWGSSYGGLMTAMSMFRKPGLYAAGIAGAPATNVWHALSGQMAVMMRPQDQPDEYADSSPFVHAAGLQAPLMIVHGMRDWVVLFKDSVILTQRLILLGKDVELVALPNAGHGWDNEGLAQTRFAFHKMVRFFDRHLKNRCPDCPEATHDKD
jgi:dipeptidyl-peptidase-4